MLPIRKISPTKVSLSSYYGKNFVEISRLKVNDEVEYISRAIFKNYKSRDITDLVPGNTYNNYFNGPYIYNAISERYKSFELNNITYVFDRAQILKNVDAEIIANLEKDGTRVAGYTKNKHVIVIDINNIFYRVNGDARTELGNIYTILNIDQSKAPVSHAEFRVYTKHIPVGLVLGYLVGFSNLMKMLGTKYRVLEDKEKPAANEYILKFNDETIAFDKNDRVSAKIIGGYLSYGAALKRFTIEDLDSKDTHFELFSTKDITSVYVKEIELTNELFIDPITESILKDMHEPTTFVGLLVRAVEMLNTYEYPDSQDLSQMRIRGYERISGFIYKNLTRSIKTFRNKNINHRSKIDLGPYDVWNSILDDNSLKLVEDINPMQDIKERDVVTYVGEGGRAKGSVQKEARSFHRNDFGVISEATVDSADVAINVYMSANPAIKDLRGRRGPPVEANTMTLMSSSANLAPFSVNDDKCLYT